MKIAIASDGKEETAQVSPISGRATYYLIYEDKKLVKTIKNPFKMGGGGAGFGVAKMMEQENIDIIVSGNFGERMKPALETSGIKMKIVKDKTVKQALDELA